MKITDFVHTLKTHANTITFIDSITVIDTNYDFTETAFTNGAQKNAAGENSGSCKIFAFAQLHKLSQEETLACFGQYYYDVLATPKKNDHQNIRQFMQHGWQGITFEGQPLKKS